MEVGWLVVSARTGLRIFDTQSRTLKEVQSSDGKVVRIYCCGPTVYRDAHVGNLRTFLLGDLVTRILQLDGFQTQFIQNITDVGHLSDDVDGVENGEDKLLTESRREKIDPFEIARKFESRFHQDLKHLNIRPADSYPRASDTIPLMISMIKNLISNGSAYVGGDGSIYFAAQTFENYGAISGNRFSELQPGHNYEYSEDGGKRFHADWALWKLAGNRSEMIWDSPWGAGFPGWHIECSAMSMHYLENKVDLHIGGIDLRFPHHENERAQSNSAFSAQAGEHNQSITNDEVVDHWLHGEHLLFEGRKMSKSAGNVLLVSDLIEQGRDPLALRLAILENRYRSQMDLTLDAINAADQTIIRWRKKIREWKVGEGAGISLAHVNSKLEELLGFARADLDTPKIIIALRKVEREEGLDPATKLSIFLTIDKLLGLDLNREEVLAELSSAQKQLLEQRATARENKDFAQSDLLRDQLRDLGILVIDSAQGQSYELIP